MKERTKILINLLPTFKEIEAILTHENEAQYILKKALEVLHSVGSENATVLDDLEEATFLTHAVVDRCWERIHTGHFSEVAPEIRQIYALACFIEVAFLLIESEEKANIEKCIEIFDNALLIGCTQDIYGKCEEFKQFLTAILNSELDLCTDFKLPLIENPERQEFKCEILQLDLPSVEEFQQNCFDKKQPALLLNTLNHWPALDKWRDLNYLLKLTGNRTVPIEIGSNYSNDEWSQQLMKVKDFLGRQFASKENHKEIPHAIEYLAQHELFDQIPELKNDFSVPDYCSLGTNQDAPDIKAWLGPAGTISPMHFDPKHNLLCQVFGSKSIILASPEETKYIYPHETEFLQNTSQIDAVNLDFEKYPLAKRATFRHLTLQPGDCLYMPPKWWHYVQSNSPSFSVSFWWE